MERAHVVACRHCERSEAIQKVHAETTWIASPLTLLAMTILSGMWIKAGD
jgi:hypothetical protein